MAIGLIILLIIIAGVFLTIRSMKELFPGISKSTNQAQKTQEYVPPAPIIIDTVPAFEHEFKRMLDFLVQNPAYDVAIEKIYTGNNPVYVFYYPMSGSIWQPQILPDFIIEENVADLTNKNVLSYQYIIRSKYTNVFYVSRRILFKRPQEYAMSGIDQLLWENFYKRSHTLSPDITTQNRLFSNIVHNTVEGESTTPARQG
jgi:hypothetical protein